MIRTSEAAAVAAARPVRFLDDDGKEIYSFHTAGANVVMCDGSVRFLKQSVTVDVVLSLLTRARGEVISSDAY